MTSTETIREAGRELSKEVVADGKANVSALDVLIETCEQNGREQERTEIVAILRRRLHERKKIGSLVSGVGLVLWELIEEIESRARRRPLRT